MNRLNIAKIRRYRNRKHLRYQNLKNDETVPFCKEQVLERHPVTGLPLLTECYFSNGNVVCIYYKKDGSWIVERIEIFCVNKC